jgi:hypothetical protein
MYDNPLPPVFSAAVEEFANWSRRQLLTEEAASKITEPLYHYTDAAGLCGIVKSQKIWFTSYLHLMTQASYFTAWTSFTGCSRR